MCMKMSTCPICKKNRRSIRYRVLSVDHVSPYKKEGVPVCMECMESQDKEVWEKIILELGKI